VKKVVSKRKRGKGFQYLLLWATFSGEIQDRTWEPAIVVESQVPDLVQQYNKEQLGIFADSAVL
jgi:hypothetical protein